MSTWQVVCFLGALNFYAYASPVSSSISGFVSTTASNPSISLTTLGTAMPICIQPRASTDPPAAQISSSLASASVVEKSCNSTTNSIARVGAVEIVHYNCGAYYLNITRLALLHLPEVPASYCPQQFQDIIDTCVVHQFFWGGWIIRDGVNWSVSNFDFPQNPLPLPLQCRGLAAYSSLPAASTTLSQASNSGTDTSASAESTGSVFTSNSITSTSQSLASSGSMTIPLSSSGTSPSASGESETGSSLSSSLEAATSQEASGTSQTTTGTQQSSVSSAAMSSSSTGSVLPSSSSGALGSTANTEAVGSTSTAIPSHSVTLQTSGALLPGVYPARNTGSTTLSQVGGSQSAATTTPTASSGVLIGAGGITQLTGPTTVTPDYSITNAFPSGASTTTLSASNGAVLVYAMQTFADLTTLTGSPILVQTSVTETESDGHHTVFIGGVWVGSGGRYWGPPGLPKVEAPGINLPKINPPCIWPFCSGRVTDNGGGGGDPGGDPPAANDPEPEDPKKQSEQNESQRNSESEQKTSMASTSEINTSQSSAMTSGSDTSSLSSLSSGTSATTSQSSLSSSVLTTTSISSSTQSSTSTWTNSSSSLSSASSSSSSSMYGTVGLPDQGFVYTTLALYDAMSYSAAVQSRLIGLVIPTDPLWAPTDSAESAEQAEATDSFSFDIPLPSGSLVAEPSGTSQAVDESTSVAQSNTRGTGLSLFPSTPTSATPTTSATLTTSSITVAPSSPASTSAAAVPSSPPPPAPSLAIIVWRQDDCSDIVCESEARVFDIAAGAQSSIDPCTDGEVDYKYQFPADVSNDNSDYTIAFGTFTTHQIEDVSYAGSNLHVGKLTGTGLPGGSVQCEVPQPVATSCSSSHSLDADDQTPIAYCAW